MAMRVALPLLLLLLLLGLPIGHGIGQNLRRRRRDRRSQIPLNDSAHQSLLPQHWASGPLRILYPAYLPNDTSRLPPVREYITDSKEIELLARSRRYLDGARAQDQEDIWLYENWFFGVQNGVIVESGALDGRLFSVSYMFEKFFNWTAVNVESDLSNFNRLAMQRRSSINVHAGLCSSSSPVRHSAHSVSPMRGFVDFMAPDFLQQWHGKVHSQRVPRDALPLAECVPPRRLFAQLGLARVDVWVLDVAGAEESALRGTDFAAVHVNAVALACEGNESSHDGALALLRSAGFECQRVRANCMCRRLDFAPRRRPVALLNPVVEAS